MDPTGTLSIIETVLYQGFWVDAGPWFYTTLELWDASVDDDFQVEISEEEKEVEKRNFFSLLLFIRPETGVQMEKPAAYLFRHGSPLQVKWLLTARLKALFTWDGKHHNCSCCGISLANSLP